MPIYLHEHIAPKGEIGLWDITEQEDFFRGELRLTPAEIPYLERMSPKRRLEWLSVRLLLHGMTGEDERIIVQKDEYGKPHLPLPSVEISLSHSGRFAAVMMGGQALGLDVQRIESRLLRVEHKFMVEADSSGLSLDYRLEHLHVYWGAKEAMYKAYGKRKLEFREHIFIEPFDYDVSFGTCRGYVRKETVDMAFDIHYRIIENHMLVYAIQNEE